MPTVTDAVSVSPTGALPPGGFAVTVAVFGEIAAVRLVLVHVHRTTAAGATLARAGIDALSRAQASASGSVTTTSVSV